MTRRARSSVGRWPTDRETRRCRALTNLALLSAGQLPRREREAAYRQISRTLRDHIGRPEGAAAAIAELLAAAGPRAA
jgi:hypothetical protein